MLALLEEMYYELGLVGYANKNKYAVGDKALKRLLLKVEELEIHPATLKRFLLRVQENYRWDKIGLGRGEFQFPASGTTLSTTFATASVSLKWCEFIRFSPKLDGKENWLARYVIIHGCCLQDVLSKRDICVLITAWWEKPPLTTFVSKVKGLNRFVSNYYSVMGY